MTNTLKYVRIGVAVLGLALAAGCLAAPAQTPSFGSTAGTPTKPVAAHNQPDILAAATATASRIAAEHRPTQPPSPTPTLPAPTATAAAADTALPRPTATASPTPTGAPAIRVPILEYHYSSFEMLPSVTMRPEWLQAQLHWLALAGFHTLSSAELAGFVTGQQAAPARSVALTFDVGASHFDEYTTDIIPALRRDHLRAIFFVMPSQTRAACNGLFACWPSLLAWQAEGLIDIESHSFTHQDYTTLGPDQLAFDIAHSKAAIEAKTGRPVLGLCYPFDAVTPAARQLLLKAGYQYAVAGATRPDRSAHWQDAQPFALPRYYPYSGAASYPLISGTHGQTFAQMLLAAAQ